MKDKKVSEISTVAPITPEFIERRICFIRGQKVMLDSDLAELYQVRTMRLNEQVKRNKNRFPKDFMFRLSIEEAKKLNLSQIAIGSQKHRDPRFAPYAFTELGVAMLSSVLNSERAVQINIFIMRAFVKLRELMATHKDLAKKIEELEKGHEDNKLDIATVAKILDNLLDEGANQKDAIGFQVD
jgi:hypothetical protein